MAPDPAYGGAESIASGQSITRNLALAIPSGAAGVLQAAPDLLQPPWFVAVVRAG